LALHQLPAHLPVCEESQSQHSTAREYSGGVLWRKAMNDGPRLAVGARGEDVRRAQTIFVMMKMLGFDQIDGVFGPVTKNAVVAFQEGEGLGRRRHQG
jgi:hypothetical protein